MKPFVKLRTEMVNEMAALLNPTLPWLAHERSALCCAGSEHEPLGQTVRLRSSEALHHEHRILGRRTFADQEQHTFDIFLQGMT